MRIMMAAVLVLVSGVAMADDTADCLAKLHPDIEAFNACAVPKVKVKAKSNDAASDIVEAAISECEAHITDMRAVLHAAPCGQDDAQTQQVVDSFLAQARSDLAGNVAQFRKGD